MPDLDLIDWGGVGGTLAGNALSVAAMRATLGEVLTDDVWAATTALADRFGDAVEAIIDERGLPWSVSRLGARVEYRFCDPAPRNGGESAAAQDDDLEDFLHVYLANRGVLMTPFHNMALMSPATTEADVDRHTEVFAAAVGELLGLALDRVGAGRDLGAVRQGEDLEVAERVRRDRRAARAGRRSRPRAFRRRRARTRGRRRSAARRGSCRSRRCWSRWRSAAPRERPGAPACGAAARPGRHSVSSRPASSSA